MAIQTSYSFTHDQLEKGMLVEGSDVYTVTGYSDEIIPFGIGVVYDGEVDTEGRIKVKIPDATGFEFVGISCHSHKQNTGGDDGLGVLTTTEAAEYAIGDDITILRRGVMRVYSEEAINPASNVFLRHTTATTESPGDFRTDADTARADQLTSVKWRDVLTAAGNASLEVNLP